jgi:hypothetical protein
MEIISAFLQKLAIIFWLLIGNSPWQPNRAIQVAESSCSGQNNNSGRKRLYRGNINSVKALKIDKKYIVWSIFFGLRDNDQQCPRRKCSCQLLGIWLCTYADQNKVMFKIRNCLNAIEIQKTFDRNTFSPTILQQPF